MMSGHFATALVAKQSLPKSSLLYFLIASVFLDFLWFFLHYLGLEPTLPADIFAVSLNQLSVNMLYSHDLLPQFVWITLTFIIGKILYKDNKIALMGAALMLGHFLLDLLSGHPHFIFDTDSHEIGLGLYKSNVYLAIMIELVFTVVLLAYYFKNEKKMGVERTKKNFYSLVGMFAFGIVFMLVVAKQSLRETLSIPVLDIPLNTTVMGLVLTYTFMLVSIYFFARKTIKEH